VNSLNAIRRRPALLLGLLLVAGSILIRQPWKPGDLPSSPSAQGPIATKSGQRDPAATNLDLSISKLAAEYQPGSFSDDQLVAIHEKDGAAAALAAAKGIQDSRRDSQVLFILTYLSRIDPEFVAAELGAAGLSVVHQGFIVDAVMGSWKDGVKALAWATGFTGDQRKMAVGKALRILVRTDANAALTYLEEMPESGSRSQALADLFVSWGGHDPRAALACLESHLSPEEKVSATGYVAGAWARKAPEEVIAWIGTVQDKSLSERLVHEVAMNWSSNAPAAAAAWIATLPDDPVKAGILTAMAERERNTIRCGPADIEVPDQTWKTKAVAEMAVQDFRNWGYQDPEGARKFLETAPGDGDLRDLTVIVACGMARDEGPAATFEWARGLPEAPGNVALRAAVITWVETDPAAAAEKLASIEPERRGALASTLAENWSSKDPAAAAAWAASYPGSDQKSLVREVLQQWSGLEPREAYHWLGTLPAGESRDEGITYMLIREAPRDPESLVPWIELISDPKLREEKRDQLEQYRKRAAE
jgi:hypothetical protein